MVHGLKDTAAEMRRIDPQNSYYAVTLTADERGDIGWSVQSSWAGFVNEGDFTTEVREASLVIPDRMAELWSSVGEPCVVVNKESHLYAYVMMGGNALVEQQIAQKWLPEIVGRIPVRRAGYFGYRPISTLPKTAYNRAPTPKERMRVLKRDQYKCRICGRKADDHVDVELHVHHVKPWGEGGLSVQENLVTLCHTCHKGLDPHGDFGLAIHLQLPDAESKKKQRSEGAKRYRAAVRARSDGL